MWRCRRSLKLCVGVYLFSSHSFSSDFEAADNLHFKKFLVNGQKSSNAGLMWWPSLELGIEKRKRNEMLLHSLIIEHKNAPVTADVINKINELVYGKGTTTESRYLQLEQYGCTKYSEQALKLIADVTKSSNSHNCKDKGIIEIGAGNGQWAKKLQDDYKVDVIAVDNMQNLPLNNSNLALFGKSAITNSQYVLNTVIQGDENIFKDVEFYKKYHLDNRILMIIYPNPTKMALNCLQNYMDTANTNNTTNNNSNNPQYFIYVGEGRNGANGTNEFFDLLEYKWNLIDTCTLPNNNTNGYERLFIFKKK